MINIQKSYNSPEVHSVDLSLDVTSTSVTVNPGVFRIAGEDFSLEEQSFDIAFPRTPVGFAGHLVKDVASGEAYLLLDQWDCDVGGAFEFVHHRDEVILLHTLYRFELDSSVQSFEEVDITLYLIVPPEDTEVS